VNKRSIAILLLVSIALQTLLGSAPAVASVCFGGGHAHAVDDDASASEACEIDCSHELGLPVPADIPVDHCGCTDVEFASIDLHLASRHDLDWSGELIPAPDFGWCAASTGMTTAQRGPPNAAPDGDSCTARTAIVRTTRLLL